MGNQLALCCKDHNQAEGTEINRIKLDQKQTCEKLEEHIDKAKANQIFKEDNHSQYIQTKSEEIFDNNAKLIGIVPSADKKEIESNTDYGDGQLEKALEYQERYSSLYQSYVPKAVLTEESKNPRTSLKNGENEAFAAEAQIQLDNVFLKQFFVNSEDFEDVELEKFMGQRVIETRRKHGNLQDDPYLKNHFDKINHDGKIQLNIPPVYIDKLRKNEVYKGHWHVNKDAEINSNIQNLKSIMKFNGYGIYVKEDKSVIEGVFRDGELDGPGRVIVSNGDLFKGIYQNGFLNDKGIFIDFAGNAYEGEFKLNIMDGYGEEIFADGSKFSGEYKRNKKNGRGKFIWSDSSFYEGEILDNNLHGKGTYQWASGLKYEGEWFKGVMQGKGILNSGSSDYYEGEFKDNKKHGFGLFWWNENKYYLGFWKDGVQHGHGKFFKLDKINTGNWNKGKFEKHLEKEQIVFPSFNFQKRVTL